MRPLLLLNPERRKKKKKKKIHDGSFVIQIASLLVYYLASGLGSQEINQAARGLPNIGLVAPQARMLPGILKHSVNMEHKDLRKSNLKDFAEYVETLLSLLALGVGNALRFFVRAHENCP